MKMSGKRLLDICVEQELVIENIYLFRTKDLPLFINNRLSSRLSECTAARFKYPANRPGGGGDTLSPSVL